MELFFVNMTPLKKSSMLEKCCSVESHKIPGIKISQPVTRDVFKILDPIFFRCSYIKKNPLVLPPCRGGGACVRP